MEGYNELAALMAAYPSMAIFRRFLPLNLRDLLIIQAELVHLEAEYKDIVREDRSSRDKKRIDLQFDIGALQDSAGDTSKARKQQWEKTLEIRAKLKEHRKSYRGHLDKAHMGHWPQLDEILQRVSSLLRHQPANPLDLHTLRVHLDRCRDKNDVFLSGYEACTWDEQQDGDLTSLTDRYGNKDILSKLIDKHCIPWYDRVIGCRIRDPISLAGAWCGPEEPSIRLWNYRDTTVSLVINTIGSVLAPLLPMTAILALYFVKSQLTRILLIMLFTVLFSLSLTLMTQARPVECFTATATFAAVLVIFIAK